MKLFFRLWPFLLTSVPCFSQVFPPADYPKGYFRDPLAIPIRLAANFGELRPNHYHMGLDIRTEKRENLPVYAAADGYVAKVKVEPQGFGQAIYINHPNGYTTLYAHLNAFFPALAAYVEQQQYKRESWKIFLDIPPGLFPVKKGTLIAYSGNTGGSQGPHLHFEIRRTSDDVNLNPLLFGLPVPDNTRPVIQRLAIYDGTRSMYEQSPRLIPVKRSPAGFELAQPLVSTGSTTVRFAIGAFDTQSGSANPNGIYQAVLYHNQQLVIGFRMNEVSYDDTRNINAHIDYKTRAGGGPYLQQLFALTSYGKSIYQPVNSNGVIDLSDGLVHEIRIEVRDANGNSSSLGFKIQHQPADTMIPAVEGKMFYPMMLDGVETEDMAFYLAEKSLYDSVHIAYNKVPAIALGAVSAQFGIGNIGIPLGDEMLVRIRPDRELTPEQLDRVVMQRVAGDKTDLRKVQWQGGWASARFRDFGNFQLLLDNEPPVITPVGFHDGANLSAATRLVLTVKDNLEYYKNFRAELDGKWLRFSNDKERAFIYKFDEHCPRGPHVLKVSVEDEAGNIATRSFRFTR
ncbi:MAG TPA: M23 family metallopeptidase [Puia sp.]|nr:M23 family metallopeptidase [Puia sp.]